MFNFFDQQTGKPADQQMKQQLIQLAAITLPVMDNSNEQNPAIIYRSFCFLFDNPNSLEPALSVDDVMLDLKQLSWISRYLQHYPISFYESLTDQPVNCAHAKAVEIIGFRMPSVRLLHNAFCVNLKAYLHHLLFLETNYSAPKAYFTDAVARGDILGLRTMRYLNTHEINNRPGINVKLAKRHQQLVMQAFSLPDTIAQHDSPSLRC